MMNGQKNFKSILMSKCIDDKIISRYKFIKS